MGREAIFRARFLEIMRRETQSFFCGRLAARFIGARGTAIFLPRPPFKLSIFFPRLIQTARKFSLRNFQKSFTLAFNIYYYLGERRVQENLELW